MPLPTAIAITVTAEEGRDLRRLIRAHKTPRKLAERCNMILLAAGGTGVRETARQLGVWPKTVRHWRARWLAAPAGTSIAARLADALPTGVDCGASADAAAAGAPATFTPEQVCAIMALALPLSHWSQSELAREAVRRGIVVSISHGSVGRFLKRC